MVKKKEDRGICNLAKFYLVAGNRRLMITSDSLMEIKRVKKILEKHMPKYDFVIETFGVDMGVRPQADITYKQFEKIAGYSLWQVLK